MKRRALLSKHIVYHVKILYTSAGKELQAKVMKMGPKNQICGKGFIAAVSAFPVR